MESITVRVFVIMYTVMIMAVLSACAHHAVQSPQPVTPPTEVPHGVTEPSPSQSKKSYVKDQDFNSGTAQSTDSPSADELNREEREKTESAIQALHDIQDKISEPLGHKPPDQSNVVPTQGDPAALFTAYPW